MNDLLAHDDVNDILDRLDKLKPNISDMIVIYVDKRDNLYRWECTDNTMASLGVFLLEMVKHDILHAGDDAGNDND